MTASNHYQQSTRGFAECPMQSIHRHCRAVFEILCFAASYLVFAGHLAFLECLMALICGVLARAARARMRREGRPFAPMWHRIIPAFRQIPPRMIDDALQLTRAFLKLCLTRRRIAGRCAFLRFDVGEGDAPSRSRRGWVVASISYAPNSYVVDIDHVDGKLIRHEFIPAPAPGDFKWLT